MGWTRPQQAVARRVLLRLAPIDEEGGVERRRVARADLGGEEANQVVELLADSRLVTVHASTVELAHEALLREWPRLRGWIEESQDVRRVQRSLSTEARKWVRLGRDEDALLRGALLAEVQESIDPDTLDVEIEREFLLASLERRPPRAARAPAPLGGRSSARWPSGIVAIGIVALIAIRNGNTAERERNDARSRALALRSAQMLDDDPDSRCGWRMWADEIAATPQSAAALRQATLELPPARGTARRPAHRPDRRVQPRRQADRHRR